MSRPHAKIRKVPNIASGMCRYGCGSKVLGGKKSHRRQYLSGHNQYINARKWQGSCRTAREGDRKASSRLMADMVGNTATQKTGQQYAAKSRPTTRSQRYLAGRFKREES